MNEKTPHRRPATFKLDDPGVVVMEPGRYRPPRPRHGAHHAGERSVAAAGADRCAAGAGTPRLSLGHAVLGRPSAGWCCSAPVSASSTWSRICSRAAKASASSASRFAVVADAGADGRDRARSVRAGAARHDREAASARRRSSAQRRPRRQPRHRGRSGQARAPEPATGARPRRVGQPHRRHHRRRRHDQAGRARIDDTARFRKRAGWSRRRRSGCRSSLR